MYYPTLPGRSNGKTPSTPREARKNAGEGDQERLELKAREWLSRKGIVLIMMERIDLRLKETKRRSWRARAYAEFVVSRWIRN